MDSLCETSGIYYPYDVSFMESEPSQGMHWLSAFKGVVPDASARLCESLPHPLAEPTSGHDVEPQTIRSTVPTHGSCIVIDERFPVLIESVGLYPGPWVLNLFWDSRVYRAQGPMDGTEGFMY